MRRNLGNCCDWPENHPREKSGARHFVGVWMRNGGDFRDSVCGTTFLARKYFLAPEFQRSVLMCAASGQAVSVSHLVDLDG